MKQVINSKYLSILIFILSIAVTIKLLWTVVSLLFLPNTGEAYQKSIKAKSLYYRVRLTNAAPVIAPVKRVQAPTNKVSSMRGYKLLGLYNSKETLVVTVEKGRKTTVLTKGEDINGFKLLSAGGDFAIFTKNSEEFKLSLRNTKNSKSSTRTINHKAPQTSSSSTSKIVDEGGTKRIPHTLLTSYTKDMDKIWKDIGLAQHKTNGNADGFKVNFVKKGSDMEKLGLKRGDILKGVNSEPLNLSTAMRFFNDINNLDNLTLTIERNGQSKDMEYEIQ